MLLTESGTITDAEYRQRVLELNPNFYLPLTDDFANVGSNGASTTPQGGLSAGAVQGPFERATQFNGSSQRIETGYTLVSPTPRTFYGWFNITKADETGRRHR